MEKYVTHHRRKGLPGPAAALTALFLALLIVCPAAAFPSVNWDVSPSDPYVGDTLVITGTTDANTKLTAAVSFEKTVSVSDGEYEYGIDEVKVPSGENNRFTVRAERVENLNVQVKKYVWLPSLSTDATSGVAVISQSHVPPMTYEVKIFGAALAGESDVNLKVTASQTISADSEGKFSYEYDTDTMPAGDYEINIGGVSKTITLRERSSSHGGGSGTGTATIRPKKKPTPALDPLGPDPREVDNTTEALENETEATPGNETEAMPESEPLLDGSFMFFGIIASLLTIALIRKMSK